MCRGSGGWGGGVMEGVTTVSPEVNVIPARRVDDVVRSMYPPLDPKLLDAR